MWFFIGTISLSFLSFINSALSTYIAYNFHVSSQVYGFITAMWSVTFILSNKILSPLSDSEDNKLLSSISVITMATSFVLLYVHSFLSVTIAFLLNAISNSSSTLSLTTTIFEMNDSSQWSKKSILQNMISYITRGVLLILIGGVFLGLSLDIFMLIAVILSILFFLSLPSIPFGFERKFHAFSQSFNWINFYLGGFTSSDLISNSYYLKKFEGIRKSKSSISILIAILGTTLVGNYMITALPIVLRSSVPMHIMWLSNGVAYVLMGLVLLMLSSTKVKSLSLASFSILIRGAWFIFFLDAARNPQFLPIYIAFSLIMYSIINSTLYNYFVELTSGYGNHSYYMAREVGNLIGSVLSGLMLTFGESPIFFSIPAIITAISFASLII
ncbi:hypothetical protein [Fervidicoccus fontis]|uniref:MFS transporter n=1 Tax=Fervidicoccus fontis TaxID=683846 RepID=A0A2J6N2W5_9CREN|nr:hypothetical protein [Fervidicoccus fontis]PMB75684.1 MAG: hypothetical protein C0188_02170 [Fervidicoccus fontis]PMB78176.1 MAG: hypothetical protein C0177_01235 [Fervidicoccus fontis]HEW64016.1 hypothetical protein [Fervidicoccus fontis]